MIRIAIVEDDDKSARALETFLGEYQEQNKEGEEFRIERFADGLSFLSACCRNFDIVFMDIDMPHIDGLKTAAKLRETDSSVVLIFITNLSQYAVYGYEVNALDFIVKPVKYPNFVLKIRRALNYIRMHNERKILVKGETGTHSVNLSRLFYVESRGHEITWHGADGDIKSYGTMKKTEEMLGDGFFRCNSSYIVNLKYVESVNDFDVVVGKDVLTISHQRKKEFRKALADYYGGKV